MLSHEFPEVYTAREIAQAAGVAESDVVGRLESGEIQSVAAHLPGALVDERWNAFVPHVEAVRVVRALRQGSLVDMRTPEGFSNRLLLPAPVHTRPTTLPMLVSTS